jgi:hypothetical protein
MNIRAVKSLIASVVFMLIGASLLGTGELEAGFFLWRLF